MEFDRESLMRFLSGKKVMLSLILIIISVLGLCIFTGVISTPWMDSLSCFDGPSYLPEGYLNVDNNTTNVDKTFVFQDNVGHVLLKVKGKELGSNWVIVDLAACISVSSRAALGHHWCGTPHDPHNNWVE